MHPYKEVFVVLEGLCEIVVEGTMEMVQNGNVIVIPAHSWHEFKNRVNHKALLVNIHPVTQMVTEWAEC